MYDVGIKMKNLNSVNNDAYKKIKLRSSDRTSIIRSKEVRYKSYITCSNYVSSTGICGKSTMSLTHFLDRNATFH